MKVYKHDEDQDTLPVSLAKLGLLAIFVYSSVLAIATCAALEKWL